MHALLRGLIKRESGRAGQNLLRETRKQAPAIK